MSSPSVAAPARGDPSTSSKASGLKPLTLSSGPRPLQLQASALSSPSSASSSRFPLPPSPSSKGLSRSNSTNSTPTGQTKRPVPKRLSSISYNTVSSEASLPSSSYGSPLRSAPLLEEPRRARPSSFHAGYSGQSFGQSSATTSTTTSNTSSLFDGPGPSGSNAEQSKQPAQTLTEKHADLLRFIAAKESKCLELRTQLEQHEAELAVLKKKWERIVSKAKAKERASSSGSSATAAGSALQGTHQGTSSGDVVVEALMGVGRYLGGLGLADDGSSNLTAPKPSLRDRSTSSVSSVSTSPPSSALPLEESPIPPADVLVGVKPMVGRAGGFSSNASRGHKRHVYSKGSNGSITSSPSSSTVPSARASLSSVSTSMSSLEVTMTPGRSESSHVDRFDAATQLESLGLDPEHDKSGAALPWIPGLNKKWEQIQKGSGLEKQAKRASLLLSDVTDMSSSILGSLSSVLLSPTPSGNGPSPKSEITTPGAASRSGKPRPVSMYSPRLTTPAFNAVKTSPSSSTTRSLLDEDDDDSANFGSLSKPILPSGGPLATRPTTATATTPSTAQQAKKAMEPADADDDWNW
ncbi:hypothetical protein FRC04_008766 [Tulasnella sp. 424]|nr:hypothetical protein FRC04_008766 [Tulasnella sp. 424]KAG8979995.1 hypothetical protein FRC05_007438 [Tulasnella sp. 425]